MKAARRTAALTALAFLVLVASASAEFSVAEFKASTTSSRAGTHPDVTTEVAFPRIAESGGRADGNVRDLTVQLPAGMFGDPGAVAQCTGVEFVENRCGPEMQVGWALLTLRSPISDPDFRIVAPWPVFNLEPRDGVTAEIGLSFSPITSHQQVMVRSDGDYGLNVVNTGISRLYEVISVGLTIWGVPGDPSHDSQRLDMYGEPISPGPLPRIPFYTNPTHCGGELPLRVEATSYQDPGKVVEADTTLPPITGCDEVEFAPTLKARPTTDIADSPSGFELDLGIPQNREPDGLASAHLRDATLTLPEGLVVNPSSANGIEACSPQQIGLKTPVGDPVAHFGLEPPSCPAASSLGDVELVTPAFDDPLEGTVYLAEPHRNPFGSLLALYLSVQGHGLDLKLPGEIEADPRTGRLTASFRENPQLPVEHLRLHLFRGPLAPLRTPAVCGAFATTSSLTPWSAPESGPPATPTDKYAIDRARGGGCPRAEAEQPSSPSFAAGSTAPVAGAFRPFVVNLSREDGSQQFGAFTATLPPGLSAKLVGTESCPDIALTLAASKPGKAEEASPSCPTVSRVGQVLVTAGAGARPYTAPGSAYLAGPYKGAPLSLAIVVPAVAGPFDLGTVVVRTALYMDPRTIQLTAKSDPIPSILQGIPLDVRSVSIRLDRPDFTLNPTSCDPSGVEGSLLTTSGAMVPLANRFQVGECGRLGFKPRLSLRLVGPSHRGAHPALRATLTMPGHGANVAKAAVTLPKTELLENAHIRNVCSHLQYDTDRCPKGSLYGYAKAFTPLLDGPLQGPIYLRSSNHALPDLVASLDGRFQIDLAGRIDSPAGRIRATVWAVPDVPVSKLTLTMPGGSKGLLVNNTELCRAKPRASTRFTAQNGKVTTAEPPVKLGCGDGGRRRGG
jgi:hypothetical protein